STEVKKKIKKESEKARTLKNVGCSTQSQAKCERWRLTGGGDIICVSKRQICGAFGVWLSRVANHRSSRGGCHGNARHLDRKAGSGAGQPEWRAPKVPNATCAARPG